MAKQKSTRKTGRLLNRSRVDKTDPGRVSCPNTVFHLHRAHGIEPEDARCMHCEQYDWLETMRRIYQTSRTRAVPNVVLRNLIVSWRDTASVYAVQAQTATPGYAERLHTQADVWRRAASELEDVLHRHQLYQEWAVGTGPGGLGPNT